MRKPRLFLTDKSYDGDFCAYKDRNRIERMSNRLKQFRRVATRYDKTRKSFSGYYGGYFGDRGTTDITVIGAD